MASWALVLFCAGLSAPSFGQSAASTPSLSEVAASVATLQPMLGAVNAKVQHVAGEIDKADRRDRQGEQYGLFVLVLDGAMALMVVLVVTGAIGRFPLISRSDLTTLETMRTLRRRQIKLKSMINELKIYVAQASENQDEVANAFASASKNLIKAEMNKQIVVS